MKTGATDALPFRLLAFLLLLAVTARAQSVRWEASEGGLANAVQLIFENCEPEAQPDLPAMPGVTVAFGGRGENTQMAFGPGGYTRTRSIVLTYTVRARQNAPVRIPAFTVKTDKGPMRVEAFNVPAPGAPLDSVASSKLIPERNSVWAGEVFGLTYELTASRRTNPQISPTFDWNAAPLVAEDWSRPEVTEKDANGERRALVTFRTRVIAKTPNMLKLEAASHLLSIQTGTMGFGILSQPRMEQVSVTSDQPIIEVKPLPAPPAGFTGAVGRFKLVSKIVPEKAAVGEPVTWTLELSGTGNWPDITGLPARDVSNDFQVVQPRAKRAPVEGKLFDLTLAEDVVLVPTKPGTYTLGPIQFVYFDPKSGRYETRSTPRTTVTIAGPVAPPVSTTPQPAAPEPAPEPAVKQGPPPTPATPTAIPRDPLPGTAAARAPFTARVFAVGLLSPAPLIFVLWFALAVRRAKQTDPLRRRREARDRIARTLLHLQRASETDRAGLLLAWQHDVAMLWQLPHAAPSSEAFRVAAMRRAANSTKDTAAVVAEGEAWATLWAEADRALYGPRLKLPSDWVARAQEALAARRLPGFRMIRAFLPQNLMPFAALLAFLMVVVPCSVLFAAATNESSDPIAAYRKGDFAAAEKSWRTRVAAAPTDWIARHNLSLVLAQQERTGEAAGHAAAAFVQHPSDSAVRWHLALAAEKSGAAPAELTAFLHPGPLQSIGRVLSPANWQLTGIGAAWGAALAITWLLGNAYGHRARTAGLTAAVLLVSCLVSVATAATGVASYGTAAHPAAIIVSRATTLRSIPTEADTTQKTSPLSAGALAVMDKTFLADRWVRLAFNNGQTGWVRRDDIVPLWK